MERMQTGYYVPNPGRRQAAASAGLPGSQHLCLQVEDSVIGARRQLR